MVDEPVAVLLRTTSYTIVAAGLAFLLLRTARIHSPAIHRIIWVIVLLQGWVFFPVVLEIPARPPATSSVATDVSAGSVSQQSSESRFHVERSSGSVHQPRFADRNVIWMTVFWVGGAAVVGLGWMRRYATLLHRIPLGRIPRKDGWRREWDSIARSSGVGNRARFRLTDDIGPLCCFVPFFHLVLAPETLWSKLTCKERQAILRHELAHVSRHDLWKSVAIRILALPQWFNPLAWKAVQAFDDAAEWACDDIVMSAVGEGHDMSYPSALLYIAESNFSPLPGSVAARGGALTARIRRLVHTDFKEETKMKRALLPMLFLGLVAIQSIRIQSIAAEPGQEHRVGDQEVKNFFGAISEIRKADLARTGLVPYRVAPPDILLISTSSSTPENAKSAIDGQYLVGPDGKINLGTVGQVHVAGKTVSEIDKAIDAKLTEHGEEGAFNVDVFRYNSKVVYIVLEEGKKDYVIRMPCTADTDVFHVLTKAAWPHPVDLEKASIRLRRVKGAEEQLVSVNWRDISKRDKRLDLLPGDRILVAKAGPLPPSPVFKEDSKRLSDKAAAKVKIQVAVIHDAHGNLEEFEALKNGPMMQGDTKQTLATLRILSRNGLVDTIAAPVITCRSGTQAHVAIEGSSLEQSEHVKGLTIDATPTIREDSSLMLTTEVRIQRARASFGVETAALIEQGRTVVMRAHPLPDEKSEERKQGDVIYVVLTPELVR